MFKPNDKIGQYILVDKIGKGSFGEVWKAMNEADILNKTFAVKLPLGEEINLDSIKNEANIWKDLIHPNIIPFHTAEKHGNQVIIVSKYAKDGDLLSWLKKYNGKAPTINDAVEKLDGILCGLEYLHSKNIVHRDLKPANILLQDNVPCLADFGISKILQSTHESTSSGVIGSPKYMPPEAFDGKRSFQTDVWAIGVIFQQLLVGYFPFERSPTQDTLREVIEKDEPARLPLYIPAQYATFIKKCLEKEPSNRFQSATEMRSALKTLSTEIETNLLESKVRESLIGGYKKKNGLQNAQTEILRIPEVEQIKQSASLEILQKIDALRTKLKNIVGYLAGISWLSFLQTWAFWRSLFYYVGLSILWLSIVNLIANYFSAGSIFLSLQETYLKFTAHLILTSILGIITSIIMRSNLRQSLKTILFSTHFIFLVLVSCKFGSLNTRYLFYFTSSILSLAALVLGMINKKSLFHFGFNISIYLWLILLMECFFNLNELVFMGLFLFVSVVNLGIGLFGAFNRYQNSIMPTKAKWATGFLVILVVSFLGIIPIRYALGQKTTSNTPTNANIFVVNSNKVSNITNTNVANAKVTPTLTPKATPSTSPTVEKNVTPTPLNKEEKENLVAEKKENETNEFIRKIALETVFNKYYTKCDKNYIYLIKFESSHRIGFKNYNTTHQLFVWDENSWYVRLADGSISSKNLTLSVDLKEVESTYWWLKNETPVRVRWEYLANVNYNLKVINSNSKWILDPSDSDFKERVAIHEPISCDEYTKMISFKKIVQ
jgi:serine/threonine protein kinase